MHAKTRKDIDEPIFPVVEYGITEAAIAELRDRYKDPDASTDAGYALCKEGVKELTAVRTAIERRRKDLKRDALTWERLVDSKARELTEQIREIEAPVRQEKDKVDDEAKRVAREGAEEEARRREAIDSSIERLRAYAGNRDAYVDAAAIEVAARELRETELTEEEYGDRLEDAVQARDLSLYRLKEWHEAALEAERRDRAREEEERRLKAEREALEAEQRVAELRGERRRQIDDIRAVPAEFIGSSAEAIASTIRRLERFDVSETRWGDQAQEARDARTASLDKLGAMLEKQSAVEAEQALRAAEAQAKQEADRKAREEEERLEREREEREREERERAEAEALLPEIEKVRRWVVVVDEATRNGPELFDAKLIKIVGTAQRNIARATDSAADEINSIEERSS